jgi:hypothetical protein
MMKKYEPTSEQRKLVEKLAGLNCTQAEIIDCVPWGNDREIDLKTLRKHFRHELDRGHSLVNMRLRGKLYEEAMAGNTACLIFLAKSRLGMKETTVVEQTGKDGAPLPQQQVCVYLPAKGSMEPSQ